MQGIETARRKQGGRLHFEAGDAHTKLYGQRKVGRCGDVGRGVRGVAGAQRNIPTP